LIANATVPDKNNVPQNDLQDFLLSLHTSRSMRKAIFKTLNKINKAILPKLSGKDPVKLTKWQQAVLAYRYYVLTRSLD
jgi:DNA-directed RNA polymerase subunit H (RpoH/RPB5)